MAISSIMSNVSAYASMNAVSAQAQRGGAESSSAAQAPAAEKIAQAKRETQQTEERKAVEMPQAVVNALGQRTGTLINVIAS